MKRTLVVRRFSHERLTVLGPERSAEVSTERDSPLVSVGTWPEEGNVPAELCLAPLVSERYPQPDPGTVSIYQVELAEGCVVQPVDWRAFAYDHDIVGRLIHANVYDNAFHALAFDVLSREAMTRTEAQLQLALVDLRSVFDVTAVRCEAAELDDGSERPVLSVVVEGTYKNGELTVHELSIPLL